MRALAAGPLLSSAEWDSRILHLYPPMGARLKRRPARQSSSPLTSSTATPVCFSGSLELVGLPQVPLRGATTTQLGAITTVRQKHGSWHTAMCPHLNNANLPSCVADVVFCDASLSRPDSPVSHCGGRPRLHTLLMLATELQCGTRCILLGDPPIIKGGALVC